MNNFEKFKQDQKAMYNKENNSGRKAPNNYHDSGNTKESEPVLITKISFNNGNTYRLYNNGKLYRELPDGELELVDNLNLKNKALIDKIMSRFKAIPTDIVEDKSEDERDLDR